VTSGPGPALVLAGAGSGKTRTLTYRVAWLLDNGVEPESILLLTFTNKAAREMLGRVAALLPLETRTIWGGTFHSIGNRLLRRHAREIEFQPGFTIMDREDQEDLISAVVDSSGIDTKEVRFPTAEVMGDIFSFAINTDRSVSRVIAEKYKRFQHLTEQIGLIQQKYEERKRSANVMDFDDLLVKTVQVLQRNAAIADFYQRHFQFILVDEYQDTNKLQSELIDLLAIRHQSVIRGVVPTIRTFSIFLGVTRPRKSTVLKPIIEVCPRSWRWPTPRFCQIPSSSLKRCEPFVPGQKSDHSSPHFLTPINKPHLSRSEFSI
jgi:DNA helicase II / ATP-dependent DNA helicase PcrA